jgi:4'-phosphopantetheinyl transferase superfamily
MSTEFTELEVPPGGPRVALLAAPRCGLDENALRSAARAQTVVHGVPHTSRSYRHPFALVAWHSGPVGVDIERVDQFDEEFLASICTPSERVVAPGPDCDSYLTSLWCSKEALAKALGDAVRYDPRRLGSPMFWPEGRSGPWRAVRLAAPGGHNAWLCWRSAAI